MIAATLAGPSYAWQPNHDETSIEVFPDLESAIVAMIERYHSNGRTYQMLRTLDGTASNVLFPTFGEGTELTCYSVAGALEGYPEGDQVLDALSEVHLGVWTWKLTLAGAGDGQVTVTVSANR